MATKLFQKRVDVDLLDRVNGIYNSLGTTVGDAFVMFLRKSEEVGGLPFDLRLPKQENPIQELQHLVELKSEGRKINFNNPKDVEDFFGDEDFSEYLDEVGHA